MTRIYCPYTDREVPLGDATPEHIIPLSLGGADEFVIPVDAGFNSKVGSAIDGVLAKDFLITSRRAYFDARGHSNRAPKFVAKKSTLKEDGRPIQVTFQKRGPLQVWDPIARRELAEADVADREIQTQFRIDRHVRLKFAAKVALSAGYFIYGELFRSDVCHAEVRALMNFTPDSKRAAFENFELRAYDEFSPVDPGDEGEIRVQRFFCSLIPGSCVIAIPGPRNLGIVVGVLGRHIATLNIPASTEGLPRDNDHDLGHVVVLSGGKISRLSYRNLAIDAEKVISNYRAGKG